MHIGDTIAAAASGSGRGIRAILRLSGPGAHAAIAALGVEVDKLSIGAPRCVTARLTAFPRPLPTLCVVSWAGRSYTGEDSAELLLPGNPFVVRQALRKLLESPGVRHAEPGEFTARAFLNGRMNLDQAEAVGALIGARTREELEAAHRLRDGASGRTAAAWLDEAANLLALVESGIDFTDQEDVTPIDGPTLRARLTALRGHTRIGEGERAGAGEARVVLAGAPNAGKSTLFNALLGRARSVASPIPGATRDAIQESLDLGAERVGAGGVALVDLAGLDGALAARGGADAAAQRLAAAAIAAADVVVHCDPTGRFHPLPGVEHARAVIRLRTKADLALGAGEESAGAPLRVCALDGRGLGALRRAIADQAFAREARGGVEAALAPRRRSALRRADAALGEALQAVGAGERGALARPEVVAQALREAVDALGELSGRVHPDDVIGRIFATFCIGK